MTGAEHADTPRPASAAQSARAKGSDSRFRRLRPVPILLALAFLCALPFALRIWIKPPPIAGTVAVLPLRNLSPSTEETAYLGSGLAERLAAKLAQVPGLDVIPWWRSQRYGDPSVPPQKIAAELGAGILVTGSFARTSGDIRCNISLVDGKTGAERWSKKFEDPWTKIESLQKRSALHVARRLKGRLTDQEEALLARPFSASAEAYDLYLKGRDALAKFDGREKEANDAALEYFRAAIAIDPNISEAYIGLGAALHNRFWFGWGGYGDLREAEASCLRALQLDNGSLEARGGLMRVYWSLGQTEKCLQLGQEASRLGRGGLEELFVRGEGYYFGGLYQEAIAVFETILDRAPEIIGARWLLVPACAESGLWEKTIQVGESFLDRFGPEGYIEGHVGIAYQALGNLGKAKEHYAATLRLSGEDTYFYEWIGKLHEDLGDRDTARWIWRRGVDLVRGKIAANPDNLQVRPFLASYLALLGDREGSRQEQEVLVHAMPENAIVLSRLAWTQAVLGDPAEAVDLLRRGIRGGAYIPWILSYMQVTKGSAAVFEFPGYRLFLKEFEAEGDRLRRMYVPPETEAGRQSAAKP